MGEIDPSATGIEGYVDMKLIENPTARRPLLFFSSSIIDHGQRKENILRHKYVLYTSNRDVQIPRNIARRGAVNTAEHSKQKCRNQCCGSGSAWIDI